MKHIPNLFTLLNLFFGCIAIVFVLQNGINIIEGRPGNELLVLPEKVWMASLFIALAAVVDFLDGFVARLLRGESALGRQLDSLADVVSFGVAPGLILYQFLRLSIAAEEDGLNASMIWLLPAFIVPCAAAYRLGKFNLDMTQKTSFRGVPTPAAGLLIASMPVIYWTSANPTVIDVMLNKLFLYAFIFIISYLMVSDLKLMSLKLRSRSVADNMHIILLLALSALAVILFGWLSVPVIFLLYIVLSLAFKNKFA